MKTKSTKKALQEAKALTPNEGMTIPRINAIAGSLVALADMELPVGYQISKNLQKARAVLVSYEAIREERNKALCMKNEDGSPVIILIDKQTSEVADIEYTAGMQVPEGYVTAYRLSDEAAEKMQAFYTEAHSEHHEIDWHVIPAHKLDGIAIKAKHLENLLDVIIIDTKE